MPDRGVCVVTHPLNSAGENATRTLLDILAELRPVSLVTADLPMNSSIRKNHEVVEVTSKGVGNSVPVAAARFLLNQLRMCVALQRRPEKIVLFFGATSYLLPILFARLLGKTVVVEPRGDVPLTLQLNWERRMPNTSARTLAGIVRTLEKLGFATAHQIVTYTPNMAKELGLDPNSPKIHPNGARYIDTERFSVQVPFSERDDVVGYVGRLNEEKGIRELAEVAKQLPDDVRFRFVGDGFLSEWLWSELVTEIESGSVTLAGWVNHDDVPSELNQMRLLVMPSQPTEGLPTTILESLACGTPVYARPVAGIPDVVRDGKTGFHMAEKSPKKIAKRIQRILQHSELNKLSEEGRELITSEYHFQAAVDRYQKILEGLPN